VLGTIGIIMAGVTIMTARDNSAQIQKGKQRIMEVVIGLVIWVLAVAIIALILPDGGSIAEEAINQNTSKEAGV
jgi:flagellar basal body-associated protein FliL